MYRALYRKWRPRVFADVVGQEAITSGLSNQILSDKVGHAYMFTGTRGTGKTTCAKLFAKAVNCESPNGAEPCGECVACKGLDDGSILDVIEIDAASNNGVDDIRDLRDETAYRPSRCRYKVYIIDEVHMLSTAAFNALLKIMEEPPSHVIFILATTEIHKVPATILSRCQRYDFMRIPTAKIAGRLGYVAGEEGIGLTPEAADLIARLADGAMRDALSLLDTCAGVGGDVDEELVRRMAGVTDKGYLFEIGDAVAAGDVPALLALVAGLRERSIDVKRLSEELVHHYRNIMLAAAKPDGSLLEALPAEERQRYVEAAKGVNSVTAIRAVRRLAAAMDNMGRSPDPRIELELALFDLCTGPQESAAPVQVQQPAAAQPVQRPVVPAGPVVKVNPVAPPAAAPVAPAPAVERPVAGPATPPAVAEPERIVPPFEEPPEPAVELPPVQAPVVETPPVAVAPAQPEAPKAPVQQAAGEAPVLFEAWPQVIEQMAGIDRMLFNYMKGSTAYIEGARVLIDGGDMFLSYMREYKEAGERLKNVIEQVVGKRYAIGPYTGNGENSRKKRTATDTLKEWEEKGVPVEYD